MSASAIALPIASGWPLWLHQTRTILWIELRKNFITARGFWIYLLALVPPAMLWLHSLRVIAGYDSHALSMDSQILATFFQVFFLRPAVFFGCVGIFTYLFRGEVLERSLHFYFLAPVRREVLLAGKYLAGLITAMFFFCGSIALSFAGTYAHFPQQELSFFLSNGGALHLVSYLGITALACGAYGALFLFLGIRFRNVAIPAVMLLLWESLNMFLPNWLAKISVLYYLRSLTPVEPSLYGPGLILGAVSDPVSPWIAVPALLLISALLLLLANWQLRQTEISYTSD